MSSSAPAIRSWSASSRALIDPGAMLRAWACSGQHWRPNVWSSCTNLFLEPHRLVCWSTRRVPAADLQLRELQEAAGVIKRQIDILPASTALDIETAFEIAAKKGAGALLVVQDPFYNSRREQLVALAARHKQPVIYPLREFAEIGGLFSYGHNLVDEYRQMGVYAGRILKGEKPAESSSGAAHKVRVRHQPKDSKDARPDYSSIAAYYRRRGDRITMQFAAVHEFAIGTKRTSACAPRMSAFDPKRTFRTAL